MRSAWLTILSKTRSKQSRKNRDKAGALQAPAFLLRRQKMGGLFSGFGLQMLLPQVRAALMAHPEIKIDTWQKDGQSFIVVAMPEDMLTAEACEKIRKELAP
jgi:hypothetical protein